MVVMEEFYHLVEANHFTISGIWKILPMMFIIVGSLCGIIYAFTLGRFKERFNRRCVFFSYFYTPSKTSTITTRTFTADDDFTHQQQWNETLFGRSYNISLQIHNNLTNNISHFYNERMLPSSFITTDNNKLIYINDENDNKENLTKLLHINQQDYEYVYYLVNKTINGTVKQIQETRVELPKLADIFWTDESTCDFLQFTPLMCSLFGITLVAFFVMFGKGGNSATNGLRSPWRIVGPSLIATTIFAILTIITLNYLNKGTLTFCQNFVQTYDKMPCSEILNTVSNRIEKDHERMLLRNDGYLIQHGLTRMANGTLIISSRPDESTKIPFNISAKHLNHIRWLNTHELYYLSELVLAIGMSAWILCAVFLIIRMVTIIDFQLIKVTVSTNEKIIPTKNVKFISTPELQTIFSRQDDEAEEEPDTEMELISHSPEGENSQITLASPDLFEDDTEDSSYELIDLKPKIAKDQQIRQKEFV
ncbi:uncharacterized protein LOC123291937 [Chrysoperla carnea]|uniref:uncharacterized protein LOC123291937 n=1 Tax=Chrysoperla carnea TaxID=189513 RepID=UPI001D08A04E|nr:uncharacterized protein LOC123291937 [Chrysoperla carnea]